MFRPIVHHIPGITPEGRVLLEAAAYRQVVAKAEARELAALARYASQSLDDRYAAMEVAAVLKVSERTARERLDLAVALTTRLPATFSALKLGQIDGYKARAIANATELLTVEQAGVVEEKVLVKAPEQAPARLRECLRRAVLRVDPDAAERRRQAKKSDRHIEHTNREDGQGELTISAPVERTQVAYQRIRTIATKLQQQGGADGRTMDQLCTDIALDLLAGKDFDNVKIQVLLTVPATTALGVDTKPGYLAGYGDVTAQTALELAAQKDATWKRVLHDPATGQVLDVGRRNYRPPAALGDHIKARTRTCTAPGCVRPAHRCDLDHVKPFPHGPTTAANLGPGCRFHHRAKTHGRWRVDQPQPGTFIWTSPTGFRFTYEPEPIADPTQYPADLWWRTRE
jgi:hypothetical protein